MYLSPSCLTHIESNPFILPALVLHDMVALSLARRIMVVTGTLDWVIMPVNRNRLIYVGVPRNAVILPTKTDQPVLLALRLCIMMLVSIVRI